jgi:hypothetical protein
MSELDRFQPRKSFAGVLQPGDCTRYEMVVVEEWDCYNVAVLNDCRVDKIIFLKTNLKGEFVPTFYRSERGELTNPWTIKAAQEIVERYLGIWKEEMKDA